MDAAQSAIEGDCFVKAIGGDAAVPAGIVCLLKEDSVAGADDGSGSKSVCESDTGTKGFVGGFFRCVGSETGRSVFTAGMKSQSSEQTISWRRC